MIYITKCPLTLILNKMVTVIKCMKNGTLCDVYCEVPRISLSHSWTCMRNAGANNQQQQQQQNELGDSRQRFFLQFLFLVFPVTVTGAFVLCHLPSVIFIMLLFTLGQKRIPREFRVFAILAFLANPVNHIFRSDEFRRALRNVFREYFECF